MEQEPEMTLEELMKAVNQARGEVAREGEVVDDILERVKAAIEDAEQAEIDMCEDAAKLDTENKLEESE
ncbi:MAG TPA: hypothetical protein VEC13_02320 [Candidatus Paceibacterota bacterium]|nr:hypothetical protein [Candidatus Paceibacterota bacterium]